MQPAPPANQVTIESIAYEGDGCPKGTAVATVSPDAEAFTVGFSQLQVDVGDGATGAARLQCKLHLKVTVPRGWSYALASVEYVGFVSLDDGLTGWRASTFHMSGESPETAVAYSVPGPYVGSYATNAVGNAPLYWSRCGKGKNLMITTELGIDGAGGGAGEITVDAIDGEVYHLLWQRCQ